MKRGVKILIVFLFLVIVGLITYIAIDKLVLSKKTDVGNENNAIETEKVEEVESTDKDVESTDKDVEALVLKQMNNEKNLKSMGINKDNINIFEYCSIDTEYGPIYFVLISFQEEGNAEHGVIYFTRKSDDGGISYTMIEDTKYLSDSIAYDSNKKILRLSASYHDRIRTNYFELSKDLGFKEIDLAIADGSKEYNFVELKKTEIKIDKKSDDTNKSSSLNGLYKREDSSKATSGTLEISEDNGESFKFKIDASHVNGADIEAAIERGAVSMGGTEGTAKKISDGVYEFVPEEDDEIFEYWEGEYKITFTKTESNAIQIKETYDKGKHSEGPYGGHNVWFDGTYTK